MSYEAVPDPDMADKPTHWVVTPAGEKLYYRVTDTVSFEDHEMFPIKLPDMVNSPPHYQLLPGVEVYDVRMALLAKMEDVPPDQVDDWSRAWEYLTRMWQKNGVEDAKKCRWYLDKLIEKIDRKA